MPVYRPDKFQSTYDHIGGAAIWDFLNLPENILRMETASYLLRPAAEALSPALLAQFGVGIAERRPKQMIGHMVRQIMEQNGHRLGRSNIKIRSCGNMFSYASHYVPINRA